MTFGSAKNNWGVDLFLSLFCEFAPPPRDRKNHEGQWHSATDKGFSGFVFKIQANMDKNHRDRVAFIRVCSGTFERGMKVKHQRLERDLRLAYANQFFAGERETLDKAYSGDIVGANDTGHFQIGDTITDKSKFSFEPIPRFSPELFGRLSIKDPLKRKKLNEAVQHLVDEGLIQFFYDPNIGRQDGILGVVGELQFDVLLRRLQDEYKLEAKLERLPYSVARWIFDIETKKVYNECPKGADRLFMDHYDKPVVLLDSEWDENWLKRDNPNIKFSLSALG
jgi:peptide chain release factor 3